MFDGLVIFLVLVSFKCLQAGAPSVHKLLYSQSGVYTDGGDLVYMKEIDGAQVLCKLNRCPAFQLDYKIMREYALSDISSVSALHRREGTDTECVSTCQQLASERVKHSDTLVVFTTCNHLNMTMLSLNVLRSAPDSFDLIVVDDHSVDGTPEVLLKKGYFVVRKGQAQGLTHSWNVGYRLAVLLGYQYIIFSNNDVLVPHGTINEVRMHLANEALVVPLTTRKGAGHNPTQGTVASHRLNRVQAQYVNNPNNFQIVQNMLLSLKSTLDWRMTKSLVNSMWRNKVKFNGFFFAVNMNLIRPAAVDDFTLFDPGNIMVSQEDTLMMRMVQNQMYPKICRYAFVYHFKSITVKASNFVAGIGHNETRNDLSHYHPEIKAVNGTTHWFMKAYQSMTRMRKVPDVVRYPSAAGRKVLALVLHRAEEAHETDVLKLVDGLRSSYDLHVRYVAFVDDVDLYEKRLRGADIVISVSPSYDPVRNENPFALTVAWVRTSSERWLSKTYVGSYDAILLSHEFMSGSFNPFIDLSTYCASKCPTFLYNFKRHAPVRVNQIFHDDHLVNAFTTTLQELGVVFRPREDLAMADTSVRSCTLCMALRIRLDDTTSVATFLHNVVVLFQQNGREYDCFLEIYLTQPHAASELQTQFLRNIVDIFHMKHLKRIAIELFYDPFYENMDQQRGRGRGDDMDQLIQYFSTKENCDWVMIAEASTLYSSEENWLHEILVAVEEISEKGIVVWNHREAVISDPGKLLLCEVVFRKEYIRKCNMHFMTLNSELAPRHMQHRRIVQFLFSGIGEKEIHFMNRRIVKDEKTALEALSEKFWK